MQTDPAKYKSISGVGALLKSDRGACHRPDVVTMISAAEQAHCPTACCIGAAGLCYDRAGEWYEGISQGLGADFCRVGPCELVNVLQTLITACSTLPSVQHP